MIFVCINSVINIFFDLHAHSYYSIDSTTTPESFVKTAKKNGIGIALTDHETVNGLKPILEIAKKEKVLVVRGMEKTATIDGKKAGDVLCLFLEEKPKSIDFFELVDELKQQDAIPIIAHPFDYYLVRQFDNIEKALKKIETIEGFNARCILNRSNTKAQKFALKHGLGLSGGSDAHFPEEIGRGLTQIKGNTLEELRNALKKRKTIVMGKKSPVWVHLKTTLAEKGLLKKNKAENETTTVIKKRNEAHFVWREKK